VSRILVIDSDAAFRKQLVRMLREQSQLECFEALNLVPLEHFREAEIVFLGVDFQARETVDEIRTLKASNERMAIFLMTNIVSSATLEQALRAGARGCFLKSDPLVEWQQAIAAASDGKLHLSNAIAPTLLRHILNSAPAENLSGVESLTDRELIIFQMLGSGLRVTEIAENLKLSAKTIESHREKIKHRLGLADSAALLHFACVWMHQQASAASTASTASNNLGSANPGARADPPKSP
jgi:DNA-binding NarL/FixJ family response regulator